MIHKPTDIVQTKKFRVLLYGIPGLGKSTISLSAPKPLWVDTDKGIDRVEPVYRVPYIQPTSYQEILDDLKAENLTEFETIVLDTGGALFDFMSAYIIKKNPKAGNGSGGLGLKGYGEVAQEFKNFCNLISITLNKHLVITFHAKEDKEGDATKWRPDVPGSTKNEVWKPVDLGGFMEARSGQRTVSFSALDERYLAKGNRSVNEVFQIPELKKGTPNTFLTGLFDRLTKAENDAQSELQVYAEVSEQIDEIVSKIEDEATANAAIESLKTISHVFASKEEGWSKIYAKALSIGLKYDKVKKGFSA